MDCSRSATTRLDPEEALLKQVEGADATVMYFCCPFNKAHRIPAPKFVWHLSRCKDKEKYAVKSIICPNDATHYVENLGKHEEKCTADINVPPEHTLIREDDARLMELINERKGTYCRACKSEVLYSATICKTCSLVHPQILFKDTEHHLQFGKPVDVQPAGPDKKDRKRESRNHPYACMLANDRK